MHYVLEICKMGLVIEYRKYMSYQRKPGEKRKKKQKLTTEEQWRVNFRNALRKLTRKMNTNFKPGDYHLVLNYEKEYRPETWNDMYEDVRTFLKKLRKEIKKQGMELKYIRVMELGSKGARHHHLVINEIPPKILRKCWPKGRININPLDESGQYRDLASYFLKFTDEAVRKGELKKRWDSSKNLVEPEVIRKPVNRRYFRETTNVPKGYYLDKNSVSSYVDANGNRSFCYSVIKIRGDTS